MIILLQKSTPAQNRHIQNSMMIGNQVFRVIYMYIYLLMRIATCGEQYCIAHFNHCPWLEFETSFSLATKQCQKRADKICKLVLWSTVVQGFWKQSAQENAIKYVKKEVKTLWKQANILMFWVDFSIYHLKSEVWILKFNFAPSPSKKTPERNWVFDFKNQL